MYDDSGGSDGRRRRRRQIRTSDGTSVTATMRDSTTLPDYLQSPDGHPYRASQKPYFSSIEPSKMLPSTDTALSNLRKKFSMRTSVVMLLVIVYGLSSTFSLLTFRIEQANSNSNNNSHNLPEISSNNGHKLRSVLGSMTYLSDGWQRLSPSSLTLTTVGDHIDDGMIENELVGKSCRWLPYGTVYRIVRQFIVSPVAILFFKRLPPITGRWECRDCDADTGGELSALKDQQTPKHSLWESCRIMVPRNKCPSFEFQQWDTPKPQSSSSHHTMMTTATTTNLLTTFGVGKVSKVEYVQPQCQADHHTYHHQQSGWSNACFDLKRCYDQQHPDTQLIQRRQGGKENSTTTSFHLKVYAYPGKARSDVQRALNVTKTERHQQRSQEIELVDDPSKACLLIVHVEDLIEIKTKQMKTPMDAKSTHDKGLEHEMISTWNHGQNHYVYGVTQPIMVEKGLHFDYASVGSVAWTDAHIRQGYDVAVPLPAKWHPPSPPQGTTPSNADWIDDDHLYRRRKYLLTFQGSIQDTLQPYYQHRWLAAEYIMDDDKNASDRNRTDVVIDVQCKHKSMWNGGSRITTAQYDVVDPTNQHFDELMIESTFGFCPGGSQVSSFRFTEVLSVGSIPVVTPEIVLPFTPELDWTGCVVRITQSRIVDLPRILRRFSSENIRKRQKECRRLFRYIANDDMAEQLGRYDNGRIPARSEKDQSINAMVNTLNVWSTRIHLQIQQDETMKSEFGEIR